jgi:chromosome partitioning protein
MAKIIALCNQKGGTGKTTTAINLSIAIAMAGKKVLLIDIDPQANSTSGIGIDKNKVTLSAYDVMIDEMPINNALMSNLEGKISVLPSNSHLAGAEVELVAIMGREYRLRKALEAVKSAYDFIFIDCPPSLGLLTINALAVADSVIIPVQCEYYALEGLTQLLNTIGLVQSNLNHNLNIEGVLLTMADYRTNLTQEVIAEVRSHFKDKAYQTVIPRNIRLSEAPSFGKSIFVYDKDSIGAKKYSELACEILRIDFTQHIGNNNVTNAEAGRDIQINRVGDSLLAPKQAEEGIA